MASKIINKIKAFPSWLKNCLKRWKCVFKAINWCGIDANTYVRIIVQVVTFANLILTEFNLNPLPCSESSIYTTVSFLLTIGVSAMNAYKNTSVTNEAQTSDKVMNELKSMDSAQSEELMKKINELIEETKKTK